MNLNILNNNIKLTLPSAAIKAIPLPLCPEISLYLIDGDSIQGPFSDEEVISIQEKTPYWSICWPSGHAMAAFIEKNNLMFKGKKVLDFGSGSGVAGIAAAWAGAEKVVACDIDKHAHEAIMANAALNNVNIIPSYSLNDLNDQFDILLAADLLFDKENLEFLEAFPSIAANALIAESRIKEIDNDAYQMAGIMEAETLPKMELVDHYRKVRFFRLTQILQ